MNDIIGYMRANELDIIAQLAKQVPINGTIVELGSMFGRTAVTWVTYADPSVTVVCVDEFAEEEQFTNISFPEDPTRPKENVRYRTYDLFLENTKPYKNIKHLRGTCPYQIEYTGESIDLLFVDLGHVNPADWDSIEYFSKWLTPNHILCGHDYIPEYPEILPDVIENVKRLEQRYNKPVVHYPNTTLWSFEV